MEWDGINKRRYIRFKFPFTVHIYAPGVPPVSTYTQDISQGGIKVVIQERLKASSEVDLEIYLKKPRPLACKGKVVWVKSRKSKVLEDKVFFDAGIEFQAIKPADRLLIEKQAKAASGDKK